MVLFRRFLISFRTLALLSQLLKLKSVIPLLLHKFTAKLPKREFKLFSYCGHLEVDEFSLKAYNSNTYCPAYER